MFVFPTLLFYFRYFLTFSLTSGTRLQVNNPLNQTTLTDSKFQTVLAHLIWRHGDRNPEQSYPTDPYQSPSFWPDGFGQLTQIGILEEEEVGGYLRDRYRGFVSTEFEAREVYVTSSSLNRTVMSAEANLRGFYQLTNRTAYSRPININVIPQHLDNKLLLMKVNCPRFDEIFDDFIHNSPLIRGIISENEWLFHYISNHSGQVIKDLYHLNLFHDVLYIQNLKKLTLPAWTVGIFEGGPESQLSKLSAFSFATASYTDEMKRLKGGPLLKDILRHMRDKVKGVRGMVDRKLYAYSAHDITLATLLNTLGIFDLHTPPYAALLIIELKIATPSQQYFVDILYRNESDREPYKLHPPGCQVPSCHFQTFVKLFKKYIPANWDLECETSQTAGHRQGN